MEIYVYHVCERVFLSFTTDIKQDFADYICGTTIAVKF